MGQKEPSKRFWRMVVASLVVHAFLTPGPALLGLVAMLPALDLPDGEELVEVDLTALPVAPVAPEPDRAAPPPTEEAEPVAPPEDVPEDPEPDQPAPAEDPQPTKTPDAPSDAPPGPTGEFGDPVALAGDAGQIADSNANVRLFLFNDVVRKHALGPRIGELLRRTPQWRDFFGPSQIDPVADIDRVLIAGPQLRNSSQVVAVVQHGLGRERIQTAFEGLVKRKGEWIDQEALVARARADRADRIFAAPNDRVVVVAPPNMEAQVRALGEKTKFSATADDVAMTAYVVTPANVTKGTGVQLPPTIKWARFDLRPLPSGGAILKILAEDQDEEHAKNHALFFQTVIDQAASMDPGAFGAFGAAAKFLGVKKRRFIERVTFQNEGNKINGTIEVTDKQLMFAVGLLEGYLPPLPADASDSKSAPSPEGGTKAAPSSGAVPSTPETTPPAQSAPRLEAPGPTEPRSTPEPTAPPEPSPAPAP